MNIKDLTAQDLEGTVITFHDNKVVATKGKNVSVAKCRPDDTYSAQIGVEIALGRLFDNEVFVPKEDEEYWCINDFCKVAKTTFFSSCIFDAVRKKLNICYKTKEEAERHKATDIAKLRKFLKLDGE